MLETLDYSHYTILIGSKDLFIFRFVSLRLNIILVVFMPVIKRILSFVEWL